MEHSCTRCGRPWCNCISDGFLICEGCHDCRNPEAKRVRDERMEFLRLEQIRLSNARDGGWPDLLIDRFSLF